MKLVKCRCNKDIRKYFFSHRVVSKWNMLDKYSVMAKTVNGFKTKLERERAKKTGLGKSLELEQPQYFVDGRGTLQGKKGR